jgi:hypothetical protein
MKTIDTNQKGLANLWLSLAIIILIAAGAAGIYVWQHDKVKKLNQQVSSLNTKLQAQNSPNSQPQQSASNIPSSSSDTYTSRKGIKVIIYSPSKNSKVTSPLAVLGKVPGSWSFEANFPVQLKDSNGGIVAQGTAQVLGDWMMSDLVPFSVKLTYALFTSSAGTLILQKDNPSGLAQNDDSVSIPVQL